MLSRISKYGNTVKAQFEVASGKTEKKKIITSSTGDDHVSRSSSGDDLLQPLNDIYNDIVDLYNNKFNSSFYKSNSNCDTFVKEFTELENKYNLIREGLIENKNHKEAITELDLYIFDMKKKILKYCKYTKVQDTEIENKLKEIKTMIENVEAIKKDNYGMGVGQMSTQHCEEMKKCESLINDIITKLDNILPSVKKNASKPYLKDFEDLKKRYNDLKNTLDIVKNRTDCADTFK